MFDYKLALSEHQITLLFWVENGCPDSNTASGWEVLNQMAFIRNIRKLVGLGFVHHQYPESPNYLLTEKGELLAWLLRLELEERLQNNNRETSQV